MRKIEALLTGLLWVGAATLLPMAALAPVGPARAEATAAPAFAVAACADGSARLAMGCASVQL